LVWWSGAIVAILIVLVIYRVINQAETTASLVQTPPFLSQTPKAVESNYQVGDTLVKTGGGATDASATSKPVVVAQKPIPSLATLPSNTNDPELKPKDANINKDTQVLNTTTHSPAPQVEAHELPKVVKPWAKVTPSNKVTVKLTSPHNSNEYFANFMTKKIALQKQHIVHISPHAYTIQLLASNDLHTIAKFIADHQLQATASVVETKINNKPRYLIIYGVFQDYGTAKRGLQELSPVLKAGNPWVRSYQSVQAVMKKTATLTH
jgi:septal ring-binding cell division protein DamX